MSTLTEIAEKCRQSDCAWWHLLTEYRDLSIDNVFKVGMMLKPKDRATIAKTFCNLSAKQVLQLVEGCNKFDKEEVAFNAEPLSTKQRISLLSSKWAFGNMALDKPDLSQKKRFDLLTKGTKNQKKIGLREFTWTEKQKRALNV